MARSFALVLLALAALASLAAFGLGSAPAPWLAAFGGATFPVALIALGAVRRGGSAAWPAARRCSGSCWPAGSRAVLALPHGGPDVAGAAARHGADDLRPRPRPPPRARPALRRLLRPARGARGGSRPDAAAPALRGEGGLTGADPRPPADRRRDAALLPGLPGARGLGAAPDAERPRLLGGAPGAGGGGDRPRHHGGGVQRLRLPGRPGADLPDRPLVAVHQPVDRLHAGAARLDARQAAAPARRGAGGLHDPRRRAGPLRQPVGLGSGGGGGPGRHGRLSRHPAPGAGDADRGGVRASACRSGSGSASPSSSSTASPAA